MGMQLEIDMPFEAYRRLLNVVDESSPEFGVLANSYVERRQRQGQFGAIVKILCEKCQAQSFLNMAVTCCPDAALAIAKSLDMRDF